MRRHSVVFKLFIVTTVLILIIFSLTMVAQGMFFERFYRAAKINALEKNIGKLAEQLDQTPSHEQQLSRLLGAFMNKNDTSISILNDRYERININPYFVELEAGGSTIVVRIPMDGMSIDKIPQGVQIGDTLAVDGIFMDEDDKIMHPVVIKPADASPEKGLVRVEGTVTDFMLPEHRSYNPLYQDALIQDALRDWIPQAAQHQPALQKGTTVKLEWSDKWSGIRYAIVIVPLPESGYGNRYVFVMTSLQPVGEAVGILKQYYVYLAPIIVLLVILLSLLYSRIVSRPLVVLSKMAARLAKLDFTVQPEIHSKDEFGELSENLVSLSRKLDTALKELTDANDTLQEDIQQKQQSEQLRKELIANISHELKTPLGIIKGFAEGLQDGVAQDKQERYLAHIVNETDRMNVLIMDMLELSKFEAKAVELQPSAISLTRLIQKAMHSFAKQMEDKQLQYKLNESGENEPLVMADPRRIEQVIMNLLSNAIRHAVDSSVITISMQRAADGEVTTVIENVGPSIAAEDRNRIWDHFYRAERSRDRKSGGTGLGLAIVKHIMELHGSGYGVVNTKCGAAFYFTLYESRGETDE
ncbi:HAMP domain-containing protein [Paenibacillaceae bacterium]|nr:HAMP domain-containing protein [Paenibacillaceae bacterium]